MLTRKKFSTLLIIRTSIILSLLILGPRVTLNTEAAFKANELLTAGDHAPKDDLITESPLEPWKSQIFENQVLGEPSLKPNTHQGLFQKDEHNSLLQLKSPGKLPGIEFGIEMHSLQAFQSIVPLESLPKGFEHKHEQPLLLPPSINAPDYNGGFLRFTW